MAKKKDKWYILVGGGYGGFILEGSEEEAEEMRCHKANWEKAVAKKYKLDWMLADHLGESEKHNLWLQMVIDECQGKMTKRLFNNAVKRVNKKIEA